MNAIPGVAGRDIAELLAVQGPRRQAIYGFDPLYSDIVDYIVRCTHRIWEQKDLGIIETHYASDCVIHTMTGPVAGAAGVIANTAATLAAFPDRTLVAEAVIWSDVGNGAFLSSHRITSGGTNLGPSEFGPATGRRTSYTTIAECLCRANRIVEEWLVRDNSALVMGLGLSPRAVARAQAARDRAGGGVADWRMSAVARIRDAAPTGFPEARAPDPVGEPAEFAQAFFDQVWNHRRFGRVRDFYCPAVRFEGPGGRRLFGHGEVTGWSTALIGSFGDARFAIDHVASVGEGDTAEIAVRWSMAGTHDGAALYGRPSGLEVHVLGVTHWRISHGLIVHEATVFDEVALLRQIEGGL